MIAVARGSRCRSLRVYLAVLLGIALGAMFSLPGPAAAQVPTANPARAWVPSPKLTIRDVWDGVRSGRLDVISSATSDQGTGAITVVTVFSGGGQIFRCIELVSTATGVERSGSCATLR